MSVIQTYMALMTMMFVGIGIGWFVGMMSATRNPGRDGFFVMLFWIALGISLHFVPDSWLVVTPTP